MKKPEPTPSLDSIPTTARDASSIAFLGKK